MVKYLIYGVGAYIGTWLLVQLFAHHVIFQAPKPSTYKDNQEIVKINMEDGTQLSSFYLSNPQAKYTILFIHGNAVDLGMMYETLTAIQSRGFSVIGYDFPGYGTSTGEPSEINLYRSAHAVYNYMVDTLKINPSKIIVYGQSLGAAVALDLAVDSRVAAVILENPFLTAFRTVTQLPLFPLDRFKNNTKILGLKVPLLLINGSSDYIVPTWQSNALFDLAPEPKQQYIVVGAGHNDIFAVAGNELWVRLNKFIADYVK